MSDNEETQDTSPEFSLEEWCKVSGLNRKTSGLLRTQELTSPTCLVLVDKKDVANMGLPLGQHKLLIKAIQELIQTGKGPTQASTTPAPAPAPAPAQQITQWSHLVINRRMPSQPLVSCLMLYYSLLLTPLLYCVLQVQALTLEQYSL